MCYNKAMKEHPKGQLGEVRKGRDIGFKSGNEWIWSACVDCGKERWILLKKVKSLRCSSCARKINVIKYPPAKREQSSRWRGGRKTDIYGYVHILLSPDDFFYSMADIKGYVREHRLVVARALGRNLHPWEIVHHKKGHAKNDNRYPETLQLVSDLGHKSLSLLEMKIDRLLEGQRQLKQEIRLLRLENKLLREKESPEPKVGDDGWPIMEL